MKLTWINAAIEYSAMHGATAYCLLLTATAYCLLFTAYCLLLTAYCLLLLLIAYCLLLLLTAYCLLLTWNKEKNISLLLSSAEVNNEWGYTSAPLHSFFNREQKTERRHEWANMGKVKRLELWWQLYVTWLLVRDLENFRPMDFCSAECTFIQWDRQF